MFVSVACVCRYAAAVQDGSQYFVLLIITDGVISDMAQTKEAIVNVRMGKGPDTCCTALCKAKYTDFVNWKKVQFIYVILINLHSIKYAHFPICQQLDENSDAWQPHGGNSLENDSFLVKGSDNPPQLNKNNCNQLHTDQTREI